MPHAATFLLPVIIALSACATPIMQTSPSEIVPQAALIDRCQQNIALPNSALHCQHARFQLQWQNEQGEPQTLRGRLLWAQEGARSALLISDFFGNILAHCRQEGEQLQAESNYLAQDGQATAGLLFADNWQALVDQLLPGGLPVEPVLQWLNHGHVKTMPSPHTRDASIGLHISTPAEGRLKITANQQPVPGQITFQQMDLLRTTKTP